MMSLVIVFTSSVISSSFSHVQRPLLEGYPKLSNYYRIKIDILISKKRIDKNLKITKNMMR